VIIVTAHDPVPPAVAQPVTERPATVTKYSGTGEHLRQIDRVMRESRSRFVGTANPIHLWWGALDLATSLLKTSTATEMEY
jgi:hypothetical protein